MAGAIGAIGAIGQGIRVPGDTGAFRVEVGGGEGPSFGDVLKQKLGDVSELQESARDAIAAFVRGDPVEIHQVMAAVEEAGIALEMLVEMRNKLTEAYRSVISMQ